MVIYIGFAGMYYVVPREAMCFEFDRDPGEAKSYLLSMHLTTRNEPGLGLLLYNSLLLVHEST